jgi:transposase
MSTWLSTEELRLLELRHKTERDKRIADRIKAVLLFHKGWLHKEIAEALFIRIESVSRHIEEYRTATKLSPSNGGSSSKLNAEQTTSLIAHLEEHMYTTTASIAAYTAQTYGVTYTEKGMYSWLVAHDFSYKQTSGIPAKLDPEKQEAFIETYNKLKAHLSEDAVVLFMDSTHPTQATKLGYGWIRNGQEKAISTVAGRKRINLTGALNITDKTLIVNEYATIDGEATVEFLRTLEEKYPKASKIHVIADGAGSHCSKTVNLFLNKPNEVNRAYLEKHYNIALPNNSAILTEKIKKSLEIFVDKEGALFTNKSVLNIPQVTVRLFLESFLAPSDKPPPKIQLHILPPYSPNLNPIERVWKVMNEYARNNKVFPTFKLFREAIMHFFTHTWEEIKPKMDTRINDNFQILNPES